MKQSGFYKLSPDYEFLDYGYAELNPCIFTYVQNKILPQYDNFDKAHNRKHVERVLKNSFAIARNFDVDINKVYVTAAYHDVGLPQGRSEHEKHSSAYLLADMRLKEWFSECDLMEIAEAIQDHRASSGYVPRSIYGKIIADADRDIDYTTILTRAIPYFVECYPNSTKEQLFDCFYKEIQDKYGENGYLKLWLDTEPNRSNLTEIRNILADSGKFKADFIRIFNEIVNMK